MLALVAAFLGVQMNFGLRVRFFVLAVVFGSVALFHHTVSLSAEEPGGLGRIFEYPGGYDGASLKPHELGFGLPQDGVARAEFRSEPFYAVILKSAKRCKILEAERLEAQKLFSKNKVFMDRFACDDEHGAEEFMSYDNVNKDFSFLAVHAGGTHDDAKALFDKMKLDEKFPGANIRKMRAVLVYP